MISSTDRLEKAIFDRPPPFFCRRLLAPNIKQREFLSEGAVQVSQQVRPKVLAATASRPLARRSVLRRQKMWRGESRPRKRGREGGRQGKRERGAFALPLPVRAPGRLERKKVSAFSLNRSSAAIIQLNGIEIFSSCSRRFSGRGREEEEIAKYTSE